MVWCLATVPVCGAAIIVVLLRAIAIWPGRRMTSPIWNWSGVSRTAPDDFAQAPNDTVVNRGALTRMSRRLAYTSPEQSMPDFDVPPYTYRTPRYFSAAWTRWAASPLRMPATPCTAVATDPPIWTPRTPDSTDP